MRRKPRLTHGNESVLTVGSRALLDTGQRGLIPCVITSIARDGIDGATRGRANGVRVDAGGVWSGEWPGYMVVPPSHVYVPNGKIFYRIDTRYRFQR